MCRPRRNLLLALALALLLGCAEPRPPSFVVVIVDTLRLDRLSFANPDAPPTPAFDRLRAESVWFERAYATSSWTLPSVVSLLVSQLPSEHGVASWGGALPSDRVTLADVLRGAGYGTAMFTANRIVSGDRGITDRFDHGRFVKNPDFQKGNLHGDETFADARAVSNRALGWLAEARADSSLPYFALVHYMDPHAPYPCPADADAQCRRTNPELNRRLVKMQWEFSAADRHRIDAHYSAGVAEMDASLGALLDELERSGVLDEAWLVLTSDHGELLGEDGLYLHGRSLADPLIRVPLLFRPPGRGAAGLVETPVSLVDVSPTLLEIAGREVPASFRGRSLLPALEGSALPVQPVLAELPQVRPVADKRRRHVFALIEPDTKWLVAPDGRVARSELAAGAEGSVAEAQREQLEERLSDAGVRFEISDYLGVDFEPPSQQMIDALRKVGYIE